MRSSRLRRWDDGTIDLREVLDLERIEENLYRSTLVFVEGPDWRGISEKAPLYGGQVAAQALLAAGLTVDPGRRPHSLHGYFLRPGDSQTPTVFKVYRDRDGRSFSARRVVAIQHGKVIFNMSTSFHHAGDIPVAQVEQLPETESPSQGTPTRLYRLFSISSVLTTQPYADGDLTLPTRFWAKVDVPLAADPLMHACALTYLSDISSGLLPRPGGGAHGASLDHAVWFHADVDMNRWILSDYQPRVTGHGRGLYTGTLFDEAGRLVASMAQEALFR